jgi:hypothetical protein
MGTTMSTISALTKEIYEGTLREQMLDEVTTLTRVQKTSEGVTSDVGGKYVVFPIETGRNSGIGARLEMEALPTPGNQSTKAARVGLRYQYGGVRMSGQTFELAKSNSQAFVSALDLEMNGLKSDLGVDLNRQVYGNGQGALATITAVATGTTFTVSHTLWLSTFVGAVVDVWDSTGTTQKASGRTVTAASGTSATLSGANITSAVGDIITRTGSQGKNDFTDQREWTGLQNIVIGTGSGGGALYNVTDPVWTGNVFGNGGTPRALSEGLMTTAVDAVRARGGETTAMFCSLGTRRAYANLLVQQRRFTNTQSFTGGFSGLAFTTDKGDIPLVVDTFATPGTIWGLNEKQLKWYRESDWSFMDRDGSMWQRVIGYDAYDATMFQYSELGTHRRNTHFVIQDIIEG